MSAIIISLATRCAVQTDAAGCATAAEVKERRKAGALKGWETRRRNGWQGRAKSRPKSQADSERRSANISRAVKLMCRLSHHDAESWLALAEGNLVQDDWGAEQATEIASGLPADERTWWLDLGRKLLTRPSGPDGAA